MSSGGYCRCPESKKPLEQRRWIVWQYRCNHSKFSGGHQTPSDYSALTCNSCKAVWRSKGAYVEHVPLGDLV